MSQQFLKTTSGRTLVLPSAQEDAAIDAAIAAGPDIRDVAGRRFCPGPAGQGVF